MSRLWWSTLADAVPISRVSPETIYIHGEMIFELVVTVLVKRRGKTHGAIEGLTHGRVGIPVGRLRHQVRSGE